ncbi:hypothetical protein [Rhodococcus sp. H29-C3]|uniref:hypothetical protein n=1 Tax=Rhodococcus sp. H29-C3 TaxID=3046307 RepID=UPI0024BA9E10|nr:hypothetical protein [Rhodococcus sp. H29-C3]MDJ0362333.1 hypothetical protein [Rhodococcus sp. H29-C3]
MTTICLRYRIKEERVADELEELSRLYSDMLARIPGTLTYDTFVLEDNTVVAIISGDMPPQAVRELESFKKYSTGLADHTVDTPIRVECLEEFSLATPRVSP